MSKEDKRKVRFITIGGRRVPIRAKGPADLGMKVAKREKHIKAEIRKARKSVGGFKSFLKDNDFTKTDVAAMSIGVSGILSGYAIRSLGGEVAKSKQRALVKHAGPAEIKARLKVFRYKKLKTKLAKDPKFTDAKFLRNLKDREGQLKAAQRMTKKLQRGVKLGRVTKYAGAGTAIAAGSYLVGRSFEKFAQGPRKGRGRGRPSKYEDTAFYTKGVVAGTASIAAFVGLSKSGRFIYKGGRKATKAFKKTKLGKTALGKKFSKVGPKASMFESPGVDDFAHKVSKRKWGGRIDRNPLYKFHPKVEEGLKFLDPKKYGVL